MKGSFKSNAFQHIYQISCDGGVVFNSLKDVLSYFTVMSVVVREMGLSVYAVAVMLNHVHSFARFRNRSDMDRFVSRIGSIYVRDYNRHYGLSGKLFRKSYGNTSKLTEKDIRSCIVYIGNNPVEKLACSLAEESRLNFLAYYRNPNPFSEPLVLSRAGHRLRSAVKVVESRAAEGKSLNLSLLDTLFYRLSERESRQLTDFIVTSYNFIDYDAAADFFGGFDNMLTAMHSTTGSDFAMQEDYMKENYRHYFKGLSVLHEIDFFNRRPQSDDEFVVVYNELQSKVRGITHKEISRLLHWFPEKLKVSASDPEFAVVIKALSDN